jgi:6-pyruvoyltetrahydropterin/6-carboxytetrahydropterin synthase
MITLTRRYAFSASHVLSRPEWDAERNREVYGKCANPSGHGHNYVLEVSVRGKIEPGTGMLIPLGRLDALVESRVIAKLHHRLLNRDVPAFSDVVPTAENIARFAWRTLAGAVSPAALHRVRLVETSHNSVEYSEDREDP